MLCWNIHRSYNRAGILNGLRVLVGELEPHVLLLQEVPVYPDGPWWSTAGFGDMFAEHSLAFAPMHRVRHPTSYYPFRESGVLVAVRGGVDHPRAVRLPAVTRPKLGSGHLVERVAVGVRCLFEETPVGIWNVHLENTTRPSGRALQARAVAAAVGEGPAVICGDFNTIFWPFERVERVLEDAGFSRAPLTGALRSVPGLDHFFLRGVQACRAERLKVGGSDHRPIYGEFEVDQRCTLHVAR